jgi:hypothetical protein
MHPRLTSQSSVARSWTIGKSMTLPEAWVMEQVAIHAGRGVGARFMKNEAP